MRVHPVHALTVGNPHHLQQVDGAGFDVLLALTLAVMKGDDLVQLVADAEHRIEGGHRFLKDHGDKIASEMLHLLGGGLGDIVCLVPQI